MKKNSYQLWLLLLLFFLGFTQEGTASFAETQAKITIDATEKSEPMPVMIYGQFIEHMGRCIYGGVWAEMLEDRKFYYPVGDKESAWSAIAESDTSPVVMSKQAPFVGEHTPVIVVEAGAKNGIKQEDLSLVKGRKYTGYFWLKKTGKIQVDLQIGSPGRPEWSEMITDLGDTYRKIPFEFTASKTSPNASLRILATGEGKLWIGPPSVMPADNISGMRADTLKLLKELNSPVYRWPGGNFVSAYDWRDGIGPRDKRPPRKNPAWKGVEHNDFGMDEFMLFCKTLGTKPYIAVNTGLGDVKNAVAEWEYVCGAPDTPTGKLRAQNGHPEPYNVTWWAIGNEMYGSWQLGNVPLKKYTKRHNKFAKAFYEKDPHAKLVGVGDAGEWSKVAQSKGVLVGETWSERMLKECADGMNLISEHFYVRDRHHPTSKTIVEHVALATTPIREVAEAHRDYRKRLDSLKGKDIRIAMDEWNYWYGPEIPEYGQLGVRYSQKDSLGIAACLNEFARNTDIYYMANYAQTVNVIGCIKTNKTDATFATTGQVLKLYREHFLGTPLDTRSMSPGIDAQAMLSEDGKSLILSIINLHGKACDISLDTKSLRLTGKGKKHEIANHDVMAYNEPGKEPRVAIETEPLSDIKDKIIVKPYSATLFVLEVQ